MPADTRAEADRLFAALADAGTVDMPLQELLVGLYRVPDFVCRKPRTAATLAAGWSLNMK